MKVKLKDVRLSFPDLFTAVEFKTGDGKPRFNATFLVEPGSANDKAIQEAIKAEATNVYGKKADANLNAWKSNPNKYAYLDGNLKEYDGYAGMMYLACHNKVRPAVFDRNPNITLTAQDGRPYAGCYVNATVEIYAQQGENPGIRASFSGVQFSRDGDAFSGGSAASPDEFENLDDGSEAEPLV